MSSDCVANFSVARTNLRPLYNFRVVLSLTSLSLHRHGHHSAQETSEPANCRAVCSGQASCPELPSRFSKSHHVSRDIRSGRPPSSSHVGKSSLCPTLPISARSTSSTKSCFPLFRSIARWCSFIVFKLRWTSLSSSVVEPSLADVPLVSSGLPTLPLGPASLFDCTAHVVVSSSPSETFPVTVPSALGGGRRWSGTLGRGTDPASSCSRGFGSCK